MVFIPIIRRFHFRLRSKLTALFCPYPPLSTPHFWNLLACCSVYNQAIGMRKTNAVLTERLLVLQRMRAKRYRLQSNGVIDNGKRIPHQRIS